MLIMKEKRNNEERGLKEEQAEEKGQIDGERR
jgi:hypothetical protein